MSISTKGSVLIVKRRLIASVVVGVGLLSLLFFAVSMADGSPGVPQTAEECTGPGWVWIEGYGPDPDRCKDVGMVIDGTYRYNTPNNGQAFCDSPDAQKYRDTNIGVPTGHKFIDGSPVCFSRSWWEANEGRAPIHPDTLRESHLVPTPVPDPTPTPVPAGLPPSHYPVASATNATPVPLPSERNLVYMGWQGICGGYRAPGDVGWGGELGYQCDVDNGVWVKVRYARTAADHEIQWYPAGSCDKQVSGLDPYRNAIVTRKNDNFSQDACDKWLLDELSKEFERRKKAASGGKPDPYCHIIGIHWFRDNYAYGQVFHNAPDEDGDCVSTPIFWGSHDDATSFVATDTRCTPAEGESAQGTSSTKTVASDLVSATPPVGGGSIHVEDVVTLDEAVDAVQAYFDGVIDREEVFELLNRYLRRSPSA